MKIAIKFFLFFFTCLSAIQNLSVLAIIYVLLSIVKLSNPYWLREIYLVAPFLISFIPLLSVLGFMLALSALLNFKEEKRAAFKNLFKYIASSILGFGTTALLIAQVNKLGSTVIGQDQSLLEASQGAYGVSKVAIITFIFVLVGYLWVYFKEQNPKTVTATKDSSFLFLASGTGLFFLIIGCMSIIGFFQSRELNPGIRNVASQAAFPVYGFGAESNYRWSVPLDYSSANLEARGMIVSNDDVFSGVIFVTQKKRDIANEEELNKFIKDKNLQIREYAFGQNVILGAEQSSAVGGRGFFVWHAGNGTDIIIQGYMGSNHEWENLLTELTGNFVVVE